MNKPIKTILEASFDIQQLGIRFEGKYKRSEGEDQPTEGVLAGSLYFKRGEELHIHIKAGARIKNGKNPFKNFEVVDCSVVSRPRIYSLEHETRKIKFPPPSPFAGGVGATTVIPASEFVPAQIVTPITGYYQQERRWTKHLTLGQFNARWMLTVMATLKIEHDDGQIEYRVMEIDPETEVGTSTNPPP
jgi:hypothetical protein